MAPPKTYASLIDLKSLLGINTSQLSVNYRSKKIHLFESTILRRTQKSIISGCFSQWAEFVAGVNYSSASKQKKSAYMVGLKTYAAHTSKQSDVEITIAISIRFLLYPI